MESNNWYKQRRYLHFDRPIKYSKAKTIVTNPTTVARHSFYPFLSYEIVAKKIYKDSNKKIQTQEKPRPIAFASHVDSHIYSYYCQQLSTLYEKRIAEEDLSDCVLAFRKLNGKCNIDFALQAFNDIRERGPCTVIGYDISKFFNNLDHTILKKAWCKLLSQDRLPPDHFAVFKSLTQFSQVNRDDLYQHLGISLNSRPKNRHRICEPHEFRTLVRSKGLITTNPNQNKTGELTGIPQGSPISAFLSNLYMLEFDIQISKAIREQGGIYYRYCDDMLFIIPSQWKAPLGDYVRREIKELNIDINPDKTEIRDFKLKNNRLTGDKPLQYLGFLFDGNNIYLRSASLARYSERMRRGVRLAKKTKLKYDRLRSEHGEQPRDLYKRKLFRTYSHLGKRNFIRYGLRAADKMQSKAIKKQLKPLWNRLLEQIEK